MHVTLVHVHVKAERVEEFIAATRANHLGSVREQGNLRFDVLQSSDDPSRFVLYEVFRSADDAAAHKKTPHYLAWREAAEAFMASPRDGKPYLMVAPEPPEE
jgi:autoinducer 2-degrading protein